MLGGFLAMIVWHRGEQVMCNVGISNVMEEQVEGSVITIHCAKCSANERPFISFVVWNFDIGVMKVCDQHQPEVHPQVREEVVFEEEGKRVSERDPCKECNHQSKNYIGQNDVISVLWFEEGRRGFEVVGSPSIVLSKCIGEQVCPPTNSNHQHDLQQIHERRVRNQMVNIFLVRKTGIALGHEDLISFDV